MTYELVVKGGRILSPGLDFVGDLAIDGERIAALGRDLAGRRELDASGMFVIPGGVDGHVHMRTERPMFQYDELFSTGSTAAAFGGTTTMIDQVQADFGRTLNDELDTRMGLAEGQTAIDFAFHMNIREPIVERLDEIPSILHAENDSTLEESRRRARAEGRTALTDFEGQLSPAIEGATAALVTAMAEEAGGRVLIFHVTSRQGVEALRAAKDRGVRAYGELAFVWATHTSEVMRGDPAKAMPFLLTPPLRDASHHEALWAGLRDGSLDVIGTDHALMNPAPEARARELAAHFALEVEFPPSDDALYDADGNRLIPMLAPGGIEVRLPLMYTLGVLEGRISLERWIEVCCSGPAELFDLHRKGRLEPGRDADVVLFDPRTPITYSAETLHSNTSYSVWEGWTAAGSVATTISRGRVIVENGAFVGSLDHGRFVDRYVAPS